MGFSAPPTLCVLITVNKLAEHHGDLRRGQGERLGRPGETTETPSGREKRKANRHRCTAAANVMRYDTVRFPPQPFSEEAAHPVQLATSALKSDINKVLLN